MLSKLMKNINLLISYLSMNKKSHCQLQPVIQLTLDHLSTIKLMEYSLTQSALELEIITLNGLPKK